MGILSRMRKHLARKCASCPKPLQAAMLTTMTREEYTTARSTISSKPVARKARSPNDLLRPQPVTESVARPKVPAQVQTLGRVRILAQAQALVTVEARLDDGTDLDGFVARALFEVGSPMATVKHISFVKLCKRPTYTLPSALALSTSLLDLECVKVQTNARTQAADAVLALGLESYPELPTKHFFVTCWQPDAPTPTCSNGLFADDAIWEPAQLCSPLHWWKGFSGGSCPNLQVVALRTLGCPVAFGLSSKRRKTFEKILTMNAKYMNEEQIIKAAVVYLNANLASHVEDGIPDGTRTKGILAFLAVQRNAKSTQGVCPSLSPRIMSITLLLLHRSHPQKPCGPQPCCRFTVSLAQHLHPSARVT